MNQSILFSVAVAAFCAIPFAHAVDPVCERRVVSLQGQLNMLQKEVELLRAHPPALPTPTPDVACRALTPAQRNTPNQTCRTSTGALFRRVVRRGLGEAWQGPGENGVIWSDFIGDFPYSQIHAECARYGALPATADNYTDGEQANFREVIPNMTSPLGDRRYFWTRSIADPRYPDQVYMLVPNGGMHPTRTDSSTYSLRCVVRP